MKIYCVHLIVLFLISNSGAQTINATNNDSTVTEPGIYPNIYWGMIQLIPSPQWHAVKSGGLKFSMRWQVTPILYSFGLNRRVNSWRFLIAEPLARYNGSVEFYAAPEYVTFDSENGKHWLLRTGLRTYFPLYEYGEYLAASLGTSYYQFNGTDGISYEAGIYFFFGILGLQTTYNPAFDRANWSFAINIRYF